MNNLKYGAVLSLALAFTACTQDDHTVPAPNDNPLSQLPGDTRILLSATIDSGWTTDSRSGDDDALAGGVTTDTAPEDITMDSENVNFQLILPYSKNVEYTPGNEAEGKKLSEQLEMVNVDLADLTLDDTNLLTQYALMEVSSKDGSSTETGEIIYDHVMGVAKLHVTADGTPVFHTKMKHAVARVLVAIYDMDKEDLMNFNESDVSVGLNLRKTWPMMGVKNQSATNIYNFLQIAGIENLLAEFFLAHLSDEGEKFQLLTSMNFSAEDYDTDLLTAQNLEVELKEANLLGGYVTPTPTVTVQDAATQADSDEPTVYEAIESPEFTDAELFTLTTEVPDGDDNLQIGGTYQLKLSQLFNNQVTHIEAGKTYCIFAKLKNNKLVGATATFDDWTEYTGSTDLTGDDSKVEDNVNVNP